jgi:hypothetical protein
MNWFYCNSNNISDICKILKLNDMILQIPITEAVELIKQKSGKTIMLIVVNDNTITVGY